MEKTLSQRMSHLISAVWAITERQLLRIIRNKTMLIGQIGLPLLLIFAFGFGLDALVPAVNVFDYFVCGMMIMMVFFSSQFSAFAIVTDREIGFQEEILVSPAPRIAVILGNALSGSFRAFYQGLGVVLSGFLLAVFVKGGTSLFVNPLGIPGVIISILGLIITIILVSMFIGGFMSLLSSIFSDSETYFMVTSIISFPLFFTSDMLFANNLSFVGVGILNFHTFNPLNYATNALRFWLLPDPAFTWPIWATLPIVAILGLVFTILSTWLFQLTSRK